MERIKSLVSDPRYKPIWQPVAVYAVAAWAFLQVVTTVVEAVSLPSWLSALAVLLILIGALVVAATAIIQQRQLHLRFLFNWQNTLLGGAAAFLLLTTTGFLASRVARVAFDGTKSIAVLPLESISVNAGDEYFASGIHEEILTQLAKIQDFKVISRTSVLRYKDKSDRDARQIAAELGVALILEGSVRHLGSRLRVTAQLIDARTDAHVWADQFDADISDAFAVQTRISRSIVDALAAKVSPQEAQSISAAPTEVTAAYDLYLRGMDYLRRPEDSEEHLRKAIRLFDAATVIDSTFAVGYARAADAHLFVYWHGYDRTPARLAQADTTSARALALEPGLAEAHFARGSYYYRADRDYDAALGELELTLKGNPGHAEAIALRGYILRRQGRWQEHLGELQRALVLDPANANLQFNVAESRWMLGDYAVADSFFARALALAPDYGDALAIRAWNTFFATGRTDQLEAVIRRGIAAPSSPPALNQWRLALMTGDYANAIAAIRAMPGEVYRTQGVTYPKALLLAVLHERAGDRAAAQRLYREAEARARELVRAYAKDYAALAGLGLALAGSNDRAGAYAALEQAQRILPTSIDALYGPDIEVAFASVQLRFGDRNGALTTLERVTSRPWRGSKRWLERDATWAALRGEPRFEQLLKQ